jgi:GntR family transcriptional repressor for pyruvate dehydrogenase complex
VVRAVARTTAADEVAERIRVQILSGALSPGALLPGERDLAGELGVSRLTLRSALVRLQGQGLVQAIHGSGTRVLDWRDCGGIELLGHLVLLAEGGALPLEVLADLLDLRRVVAVEAIGLAAQRGTAEELHALRDHVEAQRALVTDPERFVEADLAFARKLVAASHSLALQLLANSMVNLLAQQPGIEAVFLLRPEGTLAVYAALLDLVETRDPVLARARSHRILGALDRALLERLGFTARGAKEARR